MRNKAAERLAFGPDAVRQRNPNIIYAYATGYRADGPKRDRPAFDDIIQGESGIAGILQRATGTPAYIPYAIADKLCGVYLASSVSAALVARERGAGGQVVHVPMLETMVSFNLADHLWGTTYSDRSEDAGYPRMFTRERRPLRTLDGHICLMAVTDDQWNRVFAAIGRDELIGNEKFADMDGRSTNVEELYSIVSEEITKRTTNEWRRRLDEYDLPNAPMKSLTDVLDDAYLRETGMIRCYDHPDGETYTALGFPLHFSETPGGMKRVPPSLGEHSIELLTEVGFSEDEITKITGP